MGKDGAGGTGTTGTTSKSSEESKLYDLSISALRIIDAQLDRLHESLDSGSGDVDVTQEMIGELQSELATIAITLANTIAKVAVEKAK